MTAAARSPKNLAETFVSPTNEWYRWKPSPRGDTHIHVLVTLDPSNYPLGIKGLLTYGDIPVVWTNTQYKMLYMNMGHGDKIFRQPGAEYAHSKCNGVALG